MCWGATMRTDATTGWRRGYTVLELAVALAILAAITAVVLPVIVFRLDEQRRGDLRDRVPAALGLAQLDAMRLGEAVEVWLVTEGSDPQRLVGRVYGAEGERDRSDSVDPAAGETVYLTVPRGFRARLAGDSDTGIEAASRSLAMLDDAFVPPPMPGDLLEPEPAMTGERSEQLLAVFLPDGSAFVARPWEVVLGDGSGVRVEVSAWTGRATLTEFSGAEDQMALAEREQSLIDLASGSVRDRDMQRPGSDSDEGGAQR